MRRLDDTNNENPLWQNKSFLELFEGSKDFMLTVEEEAVFIENFKSGNAHEKFRALLTLWIGPLNIILKTITMFTDDENLLQPLLYEGLHAVRKTLTAEMENKSGQAIYSRFIALNIERNISNYINENESK